MLLESQPGAVLMCIFRTVAAMISALKSNSMIKLAKKIKALLFARGLFKWKIKIQSFKEDQVFIIE